MPAAPAKLPSFTRDALVKSPLIHSRLHMATTVLGKDRSLDLQAPTRMIRRDWLLALRLILTLRSLGINTLDARRRIHEFVKPRPRPTPKNKRASTAGRRDSLGAGTSGFANFFRRASIGGGGGGGGGPPQFPVFKPMASTIGADNVLGEASGGGGGRSASAKEARLARAASGKARSPRDTLAPKYEPGQSVNLTPTLAQYQSQSSPASDRSEGGTNEVAYEPFEPPAMPAFAAYEPPMRGELERAHPSILTSKASSGHL